jgi:hypothetical protein
MLLFSVLASNGVRKVKQRHLEEWLGMSRTNPSRAEQSKAEPSQVEPVEPMVQGERLWDVRRILRTYARDEKRYYLVDWAPIEKPREHIQADMIAAFHRGRRVLVRRTFFEDEAAED